jgi:hypothetical protein
MNSEPESIEWFIEDQTFSRRTISLLPHPLPPLPSGSSTGEHWKTDKQRQLADGRLGVGEEPNQTMARKPGPL